MLSLLYMNEAIELAKMGIGFVNPDKVYAAIAPKIIGGKNAVTPVGGVGIEKMRDAIVLKRVTHEIVGSDIILKGYVED